MNSIRISKSIKGKGNNTTIAEQMILDKIPVHGTSMDLTVLLHSHVGGDKCDLKKSQGSQSLNLIVRL